MGIGTINRLDSWYMRLTATRLAVSTSSSVGRINSRLSFGCFNSLSFFFDSFDLEVFDRSVACNFRKEVLVVLYQLTEIGVFIAVLFGLFSSPQAEGVGGCLTSLTQTNGR